MTSKNHQQTTRQISLDSATSKISKQGLRTNSPARKLPVALANSLDSATTTSDGVKKFATSHQQQQQQQRAGSPTFSTTSDQFNKKSIIKTIPRQISNLRKKITLSRHASTESFEGLNEAENLLEDVEPVSVNVTSKSTSKSTANDDDGKSTAVIENKHKNKKEEDLSKLDIPSSLLTLTDDEKRRLEDVLMRIGLKEVGL